MTEDLTQENQLLKSYNEDHLYISNALKEKVIALEKDKKEIKKLVDERFKVSRSVDEIDFLLMLGEKLKL